MSEGKIKIQIKNDGTVTFEVNGCSGSKCEDLTRVLMEGLGTVISTQVTEEHISVLPDYIHQGE